jgi:glucokinase
MSLNQTPGAGNSPMDKEKNVRVGLVVGVDIGGTNLRLALADQTGEIGGRWSTSTVGVRDPQEIVQLICGGIDALVIDHVLSHASSSGRLIGVGVGAPGITNSDDGIVIATSYLMGWLNVPLRAMLEEALSVPVFIDNDVNMAAFGEFSAGSACGMRDFVFLAIGTGVGAGIVIDGQIFRGKEWLAGEIGYMLVPGASVDPVDGDNPGALEEIVGGEGIRKRWQCVWSEGNTSLGKDATATQIFDEAVQGDSLAESVLELGARTLAYAIYNLSLVLNCPFFVLGGSVGLHPALTSATDTILKRLNARVQPSLLPSVLGSDAQIVGAVYRAIEAAGLYKHAGQ